MANNNLQGYKLLERKFEVIVYYLILLVIILSYLPLGVTVNNKAINFLALAAVLGAVFAYRLLPTEKPQGALKYNFARKSLVVIIFDVLIISMLTAFSGGADSPFTLLFAFIILAAGMIISKADITLLMIALPLFYILFNIIISGMSLDLHLVINTLMLLMLIILTKVLVNSRVDEVAMLKEHQSELVAGNLALEKIIDQLRSADRANSKEISAQLDRILMEVRREKHGAGEE